jgi:ribulose 1,5-bisphosphate synthetase/thiazole synthase
MHDLGRVPAHPVLVDGLWRPRGPDAVRVASQSRCNAPRRAPHSPHLPPAALAAGLVIAATVHDMRLQIGRLIAERLDATDAGLGDNAVYMRELEDDLAATRAAYVGLAVTEIASLRGARTTRT